MNSVPFGKTVSLRIQGLISMLCGFPSKHKNNSYAGFNVVICCYLEGKIKLMSI